MPSAMAVAIASVSFSAVVKVMTVSRMIRFQISAMAGASSGGRGGSQGDVPGGRVEGGAHMGGLGLDDRDARVGDQGGKGRAQCLRLR
jgi:hypothetical protein